MYIVDLEIANKYLSIYLLFSSTTYIGSESIMLYMYMLSQWVTMYLVALFGLLNALC